jgi:hypothetical protein
MAIALTRTTGHRVKSTLEPQVAQALLRAELGDVFSILGMHTIAEGLLVRVFLPNAAAVRILERGGEGLAYTRRIRRTRKGSSRRESSNDANFSLVR